ncbi:ExbD/TolR family protein [Psychromonas sp. KJ10-10]|uniref:ExbD/TolR family protein n=1 Tax=Psychromonas sp. KJ10-10 TaxID=3391823 RepID=UPI0039B579BE
MLAYNWLDRKVERISNSMNNKVTRVFTLQSPETSAPSQSEDFKDVANLNPVKRKQAISLTPLIDVVFILLLFFMLSSSFTQWRAIQLPASTTAQETVDNFVHVLLHSQGKEFSVADKRYSSTDTQALADLVAMQPEAIFVLEVEEQVSTQSLITLLDKLKQNGAKQVSLAGALQ